MLKKILTAGLIAALLTLPVSALSLEVDGRDRTEEAKATAVEGSTYVSLRAVSAMLDPDVQVSWEDGTAAVRGPGLLLTARPGDCFIRVNSESVYMGNGVQIMDGSVMVALRALAAAMGGSVSWHGGSATARLSTGGVSEEDDTLGGYSQEDLYWLARIISAESRGEPLKGKIAVGTVVLNRVMSGEFPDTIYDVIFDARWGGQFEPVRNGTVYDEPTEESVLAARMCLQGAREAGESLYFLAPALTSNHWIMENCHYITTIGCHWFYQ